MISQKAGQCRNCKRRASYLELHKCCRGNTTHLRMLLTMMNGGATAGFGSEQYPTVRTCCLISVAAVRTDPIVRRVADGGSTPADQVGVMMQERCRLQNQQLVSSSRCCGEL